MYLVLKIAVLDWRVNCWKYKSVKSTYFWGRTGLVVLNRKYLSSQMGVKIGACCSLSAVVWQLAAIPPFPNGNTFQSGNAKWWWCPAWIHSGRNCAPNLEFFLLRSLSYLIMLLCYTHCFSIWSFPWHPLTTNFSQSMRKQINTALPFMCFASFSHLYHTQLCLY